MKSQTQFENLVRLRIAKISTDCTPYYEGIECEIILVSTLFNFVFTVCHSLDIDTLLLAYPLIIYTRSKCRLQCSPLRMPQMLSTI